MAILTLSCSSSPDVMDTAIDKQKELDKAYEEAVTKSKTETSPKAKKAEISTFVSAFATLSDPVGASTL